MSDRQNSSRKQPSQFGPHIRHKLKAWALSPQYRSVYTHEWLQWAADLGLEATEATKRKMQSVVSYERNKATKSKAQKQKKKTLQIINKPLSKSVDTRNKEIQVNNPVVSITTQKSVQTSPLPNTSSHTLLIPSIQSPGPSIAFIPPIYEEPPYIPTIRNPCNPPNYTENNFTLENFDSLSNFDF